MRGSLNKKTWFLVVILAAVVLSGCNGGGKRSYQLTVEVMGVGEVPLEGSNVIIGEMTQTTDANGKAVFKGVSGKVSVEVSAADYISDSKEVTMTSDRTITFALIHDAEGVMNTLQEAEFRLSELYQDHDPDFFDQLQAMLDYFADLFDVSERWEWFVDTIDVAPLGEVESASTTFPRDVLLDFDKNWGVAEYKDYLKEALEEDADLLFGILLRTVDFALDQALSQEVARYLTYLNGPGALGAWVKNAENGEMVVHPPHLSVDGSSAAWMQRYTLVTQIETVDEQNFAAQHSLDIEVGLVKESTWKIRSIDASFFIHVIDVDRP